MFDEIQNIGAGLVALLGGNFCGSLGSLQTLGAMLLYRVEPGFADCELLLKMPVLVGIMSGLFQYAQRRNPCRKRDAGLLEFFVISSDDCVLFVK